ncbi:FecR domain-containing protein [Chitinophaga oryzae]|uniref:FecR domain-containing protein n=1 Tax=Chitinophaga oryzae TaxID=2725414 RepID=A0ABX6LJD5_9BACT|nr:FecR family protein [Chitinophaga oryzae]QJB40186.1 FecR domain-containing protein [Chitinophaga oryzae]
MNSRLQHLLERWSNDRFTEAERRELIDMLQSASTEQEIIPALEDMWEKIQDEGLFSEAQQQTMIKNILDRYPGREFPVDKETGKGMHVSHRNWSIRKWSWAVASSVALITGVGIYYLYHKKQAETPAGVAQSVTKGQQGKSSVLLTLSDGSQVLLDTLKNGRITLQGGTVAKVTNGIFEYERTGSEARYNTISTPKGKQFQLRLSDGTSVWLNAESSIKYPVVFTGKERLISVTGEVYMEVAQNPSIPFRVAVSGGTSVEVLGTSFNVNAYNNEQSVRTTLLDGAVRVAMKGAAGKLLKPGQQALTTAGNRPVQVLDNVNAVSVVAWKNGVFDFDDVPLEEAMRQLARWYDIEVIYQQTIPKVQLGGTIKRSLPLADVLYFLSNVGLHYKLEGNRTLIILP